MKRLMCWALSDTMRHSWGWAFTRCHEPLTHGSCGGSEGPHRSGVPSNIYIIAPFCWIVWFHCIRTLIEYLNHIDSLCMHGWPDGFVAFQNFARLAHRFSKASHNNACQDAGGIFLKQISMCGTDHSSSPNDLRAILLYHQLFVGHVRLWGYLWHWWLAPCHECEDSLSEVQVTIAAMSIALTYSRAKKTRICV